jgi:uncharacterized protein
MVPALVLLGLATPALLYLGRLYLRQNRLIFRPGAPSTRSPADYGIPFVAVPQALPHGGEAPSWWLPEPATDRVVIFFHGSDGTLAQTLPTLRLLHSLGVNVLAVEYPGYHHGGGRPTEAGCYQAAEAAWRFVTETGGFEPGRVVLFGQSLGSAVAAYLAASRPCGGLVIQSGFTSVPDLASHVMAPLPVRCFVRTRMNTVGRIGRCTCPVLIIHSSEDEHIPVTHARTVYAAASAPKKLILYDGPHAGTRWMLLPEVRSALRELLTADVATWRS